MRLLSYLHLADTNVSGDIGTLRRFKNLRHARLFDTEASGHIGRWWGRLQELQILDLRVGA